MSQKYLFIQVLTEKVVQVNEIDATDDDIARIQAKRRFGTGQLFKVSGRGVVEVPPPPPRLRAADYKKESPEFGLIS